MSNHWLVSLKSWPKLLTERKTSFHNFSPHITPQIPNHLQPHIRNHSFHPHLKVSRHGETGQSKEKSISFRSSRRFAIAKHHGYWFLFCFRDGGSLPQGFNRVKEDRHLLFKGYFINHSFSHEHALPSSTFLFFPW